jgi:RNA polymerase sigma-70 factor, ECF subfamily
VESGATVSEPFDGDRDAFDRAWNGSSDGFGDLLEGFREYLLLVAGKRISKSVLPKASTSDVVQNTFLEAQKGFASFRGKTNAELNGWLRKILVCEICELERKFMRSKKRSIRREIPLDTVIDMDTAEIRSASRGPSPEERDRRRDQFERLREALRRIPHAQAAVFLMRSKDDLDFPAIAKRIDKSDAATRKIYARAIESLREILRKGPDGNK